jgi:hypothetical protein
VQRPILNHQTNDNVCIDDRIIIATVAADLWGGGRKFVFEFFADSPAPYSCIRVMRRGFPPQSQSATALTSTYAVSPNYYPQIPCSLNVS